MEEPRRAASSGSCPTWPVGLPAHSAQSLSAPQGKEEFEKTQKELLEKGNIMRQGKGQLELQQVRMRPGSPAWPSKGFSAIRGADCPSASLQGELHLPGPARPPPLACVTVSACVLGRCYRQSARGGRVSVHTQNSVEERKQAPQTRFKCDTL